LRASASAAATVEADAGAKLVTEIEMAVDRIALDDEGYLVDPDDWDEAVGVELARRENIDLTDEHWKVLRFMREFFAQRQLIPDARFTIRYVARDLGAGALARDRLFELFPYGYVKQACKIAGMRRPRAWSTG
jgi:tRNA 2-thiouridine synthesizing protein E